jgi:ABC-2 type transport system permease protein
MTRLVRIELLKLSTTRLAYALLATVAGLTALDTVVHATGAGSGKFAQLNTAAGLTDVLTISGPSLLMALVLGLTVASGEFRHQTATLTYLACPKRARVLLANAIAAAVVGLVFGVVGSAVATGTGLVFVAGHGYPVALSGTTIARYIAGAAVGSALLATVGVGLGSLIRAQLPAVIGVFLWGFFGESLLSNGFNAVGPYLPFTAATTLAGSPLGRSGFGFPNTSSVSPLSFAAAVGLIAGVAIVLSAAAAKTTVRQDIS